VQGSARHLVTDFAEDGTRGNATEAPVDFASAGLVAVNVLCEQPERVFVFLNSLVFAPHFSR